MRHVRAPARGVSNEPKIPGLRHLCVGDAPGQACQSEVAGDDHDSIRNRRQCEAVRGGEIR